MNILMSVEWWVKKMRERRVMKNFTWRNFSSVLQRVKLLNEKNENNGTKISLEFDELGSRVGQVK